MDGWPSLCHVLCVAASTRGSWCTCACVSLSGADWCSRTFRCVWRQWVGTLRATQTHQTSRTRDACCVPHTVLDPEDSMVSSELSAEMSWCDKETLDRFQEGHIQFDLGTSPLRGGICLMAWRAAQARGGRWGGRSLGMWVP